MHKRIWNWLMMVLLAGVLFGASGADCAETLREASDELDNLAGELDDRNDFEEFVDDLEDLF